MIFYFSMKLEKGPPRFGFLTQSSFLSRPGLTFPERQGKLKEKNQEEFP